MTASSEGLVSVSTNTVEVRVWRKITVYSLSRRSESQKQLEFQPRRAADDHGRHQSYYKSSKLNGAIISKMTISSKFSDY